MAGSPCPFFLEARGSDTPVVADVNVTSVAAAEGGDTYAYWYFDKNWDALPANALSLEIDTGMGFVGPIGIGGAGDNGINAVYADTVEPGMAYRILSQSEGLTFDTGHLFAIPQVGNTVVD